MSEEDEDTPQLSQHTMAALMEFYTEQQDRDDKLCQIQEGDIPQTFEENWNMSQFWYSEETAERLAEECLRVCQGGAVACVSSPTLYTTLKRIAPHCSAKLFEYDTRFAVFKEDFVFYDFKNPLAIGHSLREQFDVVLADPPYLSQDCFTKTAITVKFLMKPDAKVLVCTGAVMEELAERLLGVRKTALSVTHTNMLSNPFLCLANYDIKTTQ